MPHRPCCPVFPGGAVPAPSALRDSKLFDDSTTLSDGFSTAMAQVGTRTQSAQYAAKLSETIAKNLEADRTAVSGSSDASSGC